MRQLTLSFGLVLGTIIASAVWITTPANPAHANGGHNFARQVSGSYLADLNIVGLPPLLALTTLDATGGVIATDTDDYGFGTSFGYHSTKHGSWIRSGHSELSATILEFAYDPTGALTTIFKLDFIVVFEPGFDVGSGTLSFDAFLPNQDPLAESTTPVASGSGTISFRRITADGGWNGFDDDDEDEDEEDDD